MHLLTVPHDIKVPMNILVDVDLRLRGIHPLVVTDSGATSEEGGRG